MVVHKKGALQKELGAIRGAFGLENSLKCTPIREFLKKLRLRLVNIVHGFALWRVFRGIKNRLILYYADMPG